MPAATAHTMPIASAAQVARAHPIPAGRQVSEAQLCAGGFALGCVATLAYLLLEPGPRLEVGPLAIPAAASCLWGATRELWRRPLSAIDAHSWLGAGICVVAVIGWPALPALVIAVGLRRRRTRALFLWCCGIAGLALVAASLTPAFAAIYGAIGAQPTALARAALRASALTRELPGAALFGGLALMSYAIFDLIPELSTRAVGAGLGLLIGACLLALTSPLLPT